MQEKKTMSDMESEQKFFFENLVASPIKNLRENLLTSVIGSEIYLLLFIRKMERIFCK